MPAIFTDVLVYITYCMLKMYTFTIVNDVGGGACEIVPTIQLGPKIGVLCG